MSDLNHDIERYLKGEMSPAEMHALEKKALSDPFLADALEGASTINAGEFSADVHEIHRATQKKKTYTLRIAAGVVILLGLSLFFLWPAKEPVQLAQQKPEQEQEEKPVVTDSIKPPPPVEVEKPEIRKQKQQQTTEDQLAETAQQPAALSKPDSTIAPVIEQKTATHVIAGTVTTFEDNLPLPGVTVLINGTTQGTTTDIDGNYTLEVPDTSSLVFSFVGMQTTRMLVSDKGTIDLKMKEDVGQLDEVVIARTPMPKPDIETSDVKLAEPVGGLRAYDKYLENSKRYPQQALDNDVKGRVIVGFDVGTRGELSNFVVIRSLGYGCDDEVIRLIKEGPNWNPTTESNVPVESTVHVKMKFDAAKFKKKR